MFTERELRNGLKTKSFGNKIYTFDTIDSTNNCAKAVANIGAIEGVVVIAEEQSAGKGRLGRTWQAKAGENLMFSLLLRPKIPADKVNLLPLYVAVAVAQAIERATNLKVECKWPNDLLINGKKIAGILIEGSMNQDSLDYVVIGLGINVNQTEFSKDLSNKATSLKLELKKPVDRVKLFREVLTSLETNYHASVRTGLESVVTSFTNRATMINKSIAVSQQGSILTGIVKGLSKEGGLILQTNGTQRTLYAGDVSILRESPDQQQFSGSQIPPSTFASPHP